MTIHFSFADWPDYELVDFGEGRKWERLGPYSLIRPCPAAATAHPKIANWAADAEFVLADCSTANARGQWQAQAHLPENWTIHVGTLTLELRLTPFGHVGIFPDHGPQWQWIVDHQDDIRGRTFLNLFAYTGVLSLLLAAAGGRVVHVDSSSAAVRWARRNAELSGLATLPVRWIVEDAVRFVRREAKRGMRYDGLFLDPPAFGRGPRNEQWQIERDFTPLLDAAREILGPRPAWLAVSAHSSGWDGPRLRRIVENTWPALAGDPGETMELEVRDRRGRHLNCGWSVRWPGPVDHRGNH